MEKIRRAIFGAPSPFSFPITVPSILPNLQEACYRFVVEGVVIMSNDSLSEWVRVAGHAPATCDLQSSLALPSSLLLPAAARQSIPSLYPYPTAMMIPIYLPAEEFSVNETENRRSIMCGIRQSVCCRQAFATRRPPLSLGRRFLFNCSY